MYKIKTVKGQKYLIADRFPKDGEPTICIQQNNLNYGKVVASKNPEWTDTKNWKPVIAQVETVVEPIKRRKDSFWYDGQVAVINGTDGTRISVEAQGHIGVCFGEGEQSHENEDARKIARERGYTDAKLSNVGRNDGFGNCNWFAFYDVATDTYRNETAATYDEAIDTALRIAQGYVETPPETLTEKTIYITIKLQVKSQLTDMDEIMDSLSTECHYDFPSTDVVEVVTSEWLETSETAPVGL